MPAALKRSDSATMGIRARLAVRGVAIGLDGDPVSGDQREHEEPDHHDHLEEADPVPIISTFLESMTSERGIATTMPAWFRR
jgi:hypothetical protein